MSLTQAELLHLAKLSRLRIEEADLEKFPKQIDDILGYVGRLQSVELTSTHDYETLGEAIVRQDVPLPSSPELLGELQSAFPDRVDALLRVPGVFEKPKD